MNYKKHSLYTKHHNFIVRSICLSLAYPYQPSNQWITFFPQYFLPLSYLIFSPSLISFLQKGGNEKGDFYHFVEILVSSLSYLYYSLGYRLRQIEFKLISTQIMMFNSLSDKNSLTFEPFQFSILGKLLVTPIMVL